MGALVVVKKSPLYYAIKAEKERKKAIQGDKYVEPTPAVEIEITEE